MNFKIGKGASNDLEKIWVYTFENWPVEQADRYLNLLFDEIEYLAENPKSGKNYGKIRRGYFRSKVKSHVIFYKMNLKEETLEVIRILHQQMDIDSHIKE